MAASKKNARTSKTAHVLNVITGGQEPAEPLGAETEEAAPAPPAEASPPAPVRQSGSLPVPILEMAPDSDDGLSRQILGALAEEVGLELPPEPELEPRWEAPPQAAQSPAPVPMPAPEPQPARQSAPPEPSLPAQAAPQPKTVRQFAPEEFGEEPESLPPQGQPAAGQPAPQSPPQAAPAPVLPRHAEVAESEYVNVVQALVEEKAPKYLEMLGVCKCSRCVADVKALALSNLPPKYIVAPKSQRVPMVTVYEGRYNAAITAQLLAACRTVIDHPRH